MSKSRAKRRWWVEKKKKKNHVCLDTYDYMVNQDNYTDRLLTGFGLIGKDE